MPHRLLVAASGILVVDGRWVFPALSVGERFSFSEKVPVFLRFLAFGELFQNIFTAISRFFEVFKRALCRFLGENAVFQAELFPRGR